MDKKRIAVLLSALFAMTSLVSAQTQAPKPPAAMVYVPVGVTGPKGAVLDLKKDNFVLLEDGIEQTLTAFYEPNSRIDIDIILAMRALNKGRTDQNSVKIREAIENFRHQGNSQNKYTVEEMPFGANGLPGEVYYIDNVKAYTQREKVRNRFTGHFDDPDERHRVGLLAAQRTRNPQAEKSCLRHSLDHWHRQPTRSLTFFCECSNLRGERRSGSDERGWSGISH